MKRPSFQFYPGDWRKDVELRSCSIAARGLWIDMMCIAHECEPYGHLMVNGKPMTPAQIAGQVGMTSAAVDKLLSELIENGVARKTADGAIYSKRMVEDESVRNARAEGGNAGSSHGIKGASHGKKGGRPRKETGGEKTPLKTPLDIFEEPPPSSSSSSSVNSVPNGTGGDAAKPVAELTKDELWKAGKSLLAQAGTPPKQCGSIVGKLVKDYGDAVVIDAVRAAVVVRPVDPIEFLKATCMRTVGQRGSLNRQEAVEQRNRAVADAWAKQGEPHATA